VYTNIHTRTYLLFRPSSSARLCVGQPACPLTPHPIRFIAIHICSYWLGFAPLHTSHPPPARDQDRVNEPERVRLISRDYRTGSSNIERICVAHALMICFPPQGTPPLPTQQPTWPTAHTAHSQHGTSRYKVRSLTPPPILD